MRKDKRGILGLTLNTKYTDTLKLDKYSPD